METTQIISMKRALSVEEEVCVKKAKVEPDQKPWQKNWCGFMKIRVIDEEKQTLFWIF